MQKCSYDCVTNLRAFGTESCFSRSANLQTTNLRRLAEPSFFDLTSSIKKLVPPQTKDGRALMVRPGGTVRNVRWL